MGNKKSTKAKHTPVKKASPKSTLTPSQKKNRVSLNGAALEVDVQYKKLLDNLPVTVLRYNLKSKKYNFLNSSKVLSGHTLKEWNELNKAGRKGLIHPDDLEKYSASIREWEQHERKNPLSLKYRIRHKRGHFIWMENRLCLEYSSSGNPVCVIELSTDVTEREEARLKFDKLRLNGASFRNLVSSSTDGIIVASLDYAIIFVNESASEITGYSDNDLLFLTLNDLLPSTERENVIGRIERRTDAGRRSRQFETQIRCQDGSSKTIELTAASSTWLDKPVNVFTLRDVEERRLSIGKRISSSVRKAVQQRYTFEGIISKDPAILKIFETLPTIANSDSSLLITGESGTGKELLVKAIHNLSPRRNKPLVTVNSGALPDTLIESELFGYKKGAFTDAKEDKPGRFVQADGGTLFLDEIGEISSAMQVKLLRVLEEKIIEPLGGKESIKVDIRVLAATNCDLEGMIEAGSFRKDLYYRINVVKLVMPPLRKRREDIPILAESFIGKFNQLFGKDITSISPQAMGLLMNYDYPGNVRELENFIEHAFLLCRGDKILPEHLPDVFQAGVNVHKPFPFMQAPEQSIFEKDSTTTMKDIESRMILSSLKKNRWNRTAASEELGIHRITLNRKILKLGIELPEVDGRSAYRNRV